MYLTSRVFIPRVIMTNLCTSRCLLSLSVLLLLASRCGTAVGQQGNQRTHKISSSSSTSSSLDPSEVARQNRITQHILAQYLQRRLFPQLTPRSPSVSILTSPRTRSPLQNLQNLDEISEQELEQELETVESEQISNVYDDEENELFNEGRGTGGPSRLQREKCVLLCGTQETIKAATTSASISTAGSSTTTTEPTDLRSRFTTSSPPVNSLPEEDEEEEDDYFEGLSECTNCVDEGPAINKWTMPLLKLGEKRYYLGIFFRANWYRAAQYCRYHGMHLASISSQEENDKLEKHIRDFGLGHEHFWTSGTDQAEEGQFFWMSTGRPITFTNWNTGEPNNFRYENGEEEHCLELWNRDGKGLKWNDSPCSFETYFVCEVGM